MLLILFSGPVCLLCIYLAWLCYRQAHYRQTWVILTLGLLLLLNSLVIVGAGYLSAASVVPSYGWR